MRPVFGAGEDWNADDKNISEEAVIGKILASLGESEAWIEAGRTPENKAGLKRQTERAMNLGIFGAPSFVVGNCELFWGDDRMEDAFEWASGVRL
ncbi:MAG: DsbA family protein [Actinomycetota bacterium]|nr:DsbA family protein [Rubrobacter sp.]MDQ3509138.1 DsbA family protein [Actinomycetota bacterium]